MDFIVHTWLTPLWVLANPSNPLNLFKPGETAEEAEAIKSFLLLPLLL
jgi:hypothetical protein